MPITPHARFYFDYLDPLSYLVDRELRAVLDGASTLELERVPLELCPPPEPLLDPDGRRWRERWEAARRIAADREPVTLDEPRILPWTRKAHELVAHARESGKGEEIHRALFEALFARGLDIGRVDVLVGLAGEAGLDAMETKAVLDVDRHAEEVATLRRVALEAAGGEPPVVARGGERLRGFHNREALRTFLLR